MKDIKETFSAVFNIRSGEGVAAALLLTYSFFNGMAMVFLCTTSYALFLLEYEVTSLPWVYIYSAVINTLLGLLSARITSARGHGNKPALSFPIFMFSMLFISLLSVTSFYFLLKTESNPLTKMAFAVCYYVVSTFAGLGFWSLAGHVFNVRQGKRLFGLIGSGEIIAGIIGGFSVPVLLKTMKTNDLVLISSFGIIVCIVIFIYIKKRFKLQPSEENEEDKEDRKPAIHILKNRYLLMVCGVNALSVIGYYLVDFMFFDQAEKHYLEESQMAGFLGMYFAVFRISILIGNAFLSGRLLTRFGLSIGLLAFPVSIAAGATIAIFANSIIGSAVFFFWTIVCIKIFDEVFRCAIEDPSIRILCQPLSPGMRIWAMTIVESVVEPIAAATIGIMLLILAPMLKAIGLIIFLFLILCAWFSVAFVLRHEYTTVLMNALAKRKLVGNALSLEDGSSIAVLRKGLKSTIPGEVIYCLNMLEEIEHESLNIFMIDLLEHADSQVRQHVLKKIASLGYTSAIEPLKRRMGAGSVEPIEKNPAVFGELLRTLCALSETEAFDRVFPYLKDPDLEIRKGAMVGLLTHGGIDGVLSAGAKLNSLLDSKDAVERKFAAQVLGEVRISGFYRPLMLLLQDNDIEVVRAAVEASGRMKNPKLLPLLLNNFSVPALANAAVTAVTAFGETILPELEEAFDREGQLSHVKIKIARIIGRIQGERAIAVLKKKIDYAEEDVRNHILSSLILCRYRASTRDEENMIRERIKEEVEDAAWTLAVIMDIGESDETEMLLRGLKGDIEKNRNRIFMLLAMIYPARSILDAQLNLKTILTEKRANALEALDNILSSNIKEMVLPLLDDTTMAQRYSRMNALFPQKPMGRHERLKEIISRSQQWTSSWTKMCALFMIGKIATMEFYDTCVAALSDPESPVRETAVWALGCLNPDDLVERLHPLKLDKSERVRRWARFVTDSVGFSSIPVGKGYLTRSGRYTVDLFANILHDEGERRARRCRAANILSRFQGDTARNALLQGLTITDKNVRGAVLDALVKGNFIIEARSRGELSKLFRIELDDARRILISIITFLPEKKAGRLIDALNQEIHFNRRRMLSILNLLDEKKERTTEIFYWYILQHDKAAPKSVASELRAFLSKLNDPELKIKVFTLFQYRDPNRLKKMLSLDWDYNTEENIEAQLKRIAFSSSVYTLSWTRICAIEMIVELDMVSCVPQIIEKLRDIHDVVRATAAWALFKLKPDIYAQHAQKLKNDLSPLVARTARQLEI